MPEYDVVVLGGGSGSQVATAAADRGLEAAVIEPGPLGGACITRGCIPSKALLQRADIVDGIRRADRFGIDATLEGVDYGAITASIHETVYEKADTKQRTLEDADTITLYRGEGRFIGDHTLTVEAVDDPTNTEEIRGEHVVVAVGSRPVVPPIDGIDEVEFLTSDTVLYHESQPDSLVIVGGGYIGVELGYFFGALGTDVTIIGRSEQLIPREDDDVSVAVTDAIERRCEVVTDYEVTAIDQDDGHVTVRAEPVGNDASGGSEPLEQSAEKLLVATGRRPNTDTLTLEQTALEVDDGGYVETDATLETAAENVWALGDVLAEQPYKHAADYEAEVVTANVLDDADRAVDYSAVAHAIFTSPQVACVGQTESELADGGIEYESTRVGYDVAPKGLLLEVDDAFIKVLAAPDGDVLGCHIVGPEAATLIHEVVVGLARGDGTVDDIAETVHVHPALSEVVFAAFDEAADRPYSTSPDWRDVG